MNQDIFPKNEFAFYLQFAQHLLIFFIPAAIGVVISILYKEFIINHSKKKVSIHQILYRLFVWSVPSSLIVCMVDIIIGPKLTDAMRLVIFGSAIIVGMIGEQITKALMNFRIIIKIIQVILKDIGGAVGKIKIDKCLDEILEAEKESKKESTSDENTESSETEEDK